MTPLDSFQHRTGRAGSPNLDSLEKGRAGSPKNGGQGVENG